MATKILKKQERKRSIITGPEIQKMLKSVDCDDNGLDGFIYIANLITPQVAMWFNDEWAVEEWRFRAVDVYRISTCVGGLCRIDFNLMFEVDDEVEDIPHFSYFSFYRDGMFIDAQPMFAPDETTRMIYPCGAEDDLPKDVKELIAYIDN